MVLAGAGLGHESRVTTTPIRRTSRDWSMRAACSVITAILAKVNLPKGSIASVATVLVPVMFNSRRRKSDREQVRAAIVNPKRLSAELQMDVCMQCHLETTSAELPQAIRRFDREPFSYRPGEPLGSYMVHFDHPPETGHDDKFEIVNQAYRLRKSACFLESKGQMTCSSCHNPHNVPRGADAVAYYRAKCVACHETSPRRNIRSCRPRTAHRATCQNDAPKMPFM